MLKKITLPLTLLALASCGPKSIHVTPDGPTIADAVKEAAEYAAAHKGRSIDIIISDGEYRLSEVITIDGSRFTAPLTIRAAEGAHPVLTGLTGTGPWKEVTDPYALRRIPDVTNVLQADLPTTGALDFGCATGDQNRLDFYFDGKRQFPAQWPNRGLATAGELLATRENSPENFSGEAIYSYSQQRMDAWADEKCPAMHGYWLFDWFDLYNPIKVDKEKRTFTIESPTSPWGYRSGCHFRGINLLCELDAPGEYWLDPDTGHLFWFVPEDFDMNSDPDGNRTAVSSFGGEQVFVLDDCRRLTIKGLTVTGCRGGVIRINSGENVTITDCTFHGIANDAITAEGGYGHEIRECTLSELGCSGIILTGGDRETLAPSGFEVSGCTIENLSLYRKTYQPCIRFGGCGLLISHNCFRNGPSSALRLDGNDIKVEYNVFDNLVTESDDQGAIDIWNDYTFRGIEISHNYFHHVGEPHFHWAAGVRFDDRISGLKVLSNIFNRCGSSEFGAVQIHGGQDNLISGNIFYDCTMAVSHTPWNFETWEDRNSEYRPSLGLTPALDSLTDMGKVYLERYPDIAHVFDTTFFNVNYVRGNLIVNAGKLTNNDSFLVFENNELIKDAEHGFGHWLSRDTQISKGLDPIDINQIGPAGYSEKVTE